MEHFGFRVLLLQRVCQRKQRWENHVVDQMGLEFWLSGAVVCSISERDFAARTQRDRKGDRMKLLAGTRIENKKSRRTSVLKKGGTAMGYQTNTMGVSKFAFRSHFFSFKTEASLFFAKFGAKMHMLDVFCFRGEG